MTKLQELRMLRERVRELEAEVLSHRELENVVIDRLEIVRHQRDHADDIAVARVQATIGHLRARIAKMMSIADAHVEAGVNLGAQALAIAIIEAGMEE